MTQTFTQAVLLTALAVSAVGLPSCSFAAQSQSTAPALRSDIYAPVLSIDTSPICRDVLRDLRAHFLTEKPWEYEDGQLLETVNEDALEKQSASDGTDNSAIQVDGEKLYISRTTFPGCGGACESQGLKVSTTPVERYGKAFAGTEPGRSWSLRRDKKGHFYAVGAGNDSQFYVYQITTAKGLELSCKAELQVGNQRSQNDDDWKAAAASLDALRKSAIGITRGGGFCGSMNTWGRWQGYVAAALPQTLSRPWALAPPAVGGNNSYGDYERVAPSIEDWSLGGLSEFQAFSNYRRQLATTTDDVALFYAKKFHWPQADSKAIAEKALTHALSRGLGFYMYEPFVDDSERKLRRAILEHHSIDEIKAIGANIREIDGSHKLNGESLLNIAIMYPEALRYLLAQGADPNKANDFGKTPLMYAAQYNQEVATAILLEGGADPNSATIWPLDNCFYTLETSSMSPLHYATRYASADVVRLLLKNGAASYIQTQHHQGAGEFPLDWLRKYTATGSKEPNPNISPDEARALEPLLIVPDQNGRARLADQLTKQAEASYAKGQVSNAYRSLSSALKAQSDNERALRDMSLVGLKAGQLGIAVKAATATIAANKSALATADALFNEGLACEQGHGWIAFDGQNYCQGRLIELFLASYQIVPSSDRSAKLVSLFRDGKLKVCSVEKDGKQVQYHFSYMNSLSKTSTAGQRVFVLHPSADIIDPSSITYTDSNKDQGAVHPRFVETIALQAGLSISILHSDDYHQRPISINGETCSDYR